MTPNPASGYHIDHWDGTDSSSSNHLTMLAGAQTVTAYYVQDTAACFQLIKDYSGSGSHDCIADQFKWMFQWLLPCAAIHHHDTQSSQWLSHRSLGWYR